MKSTYVGTRSANVGDIRCSFAPASDSTSENNTPTALKGCGVKTKHPLVVFF